MIVEVTQQLSVEPGFELRHFCNRKPGPLMATTSFSSVQTTVLARSNSAFREGGSKQL